MNELPRHRAFLLQLSISTDPESDEVTGRVEHVQSGRACRFGNRSELFAFLGHTLSTRPDAERKTDSSEFINPDS